MVADNLQHVAYNTVTSPTTSDSLT